MEKSPLELLKEQEELIAYVSGKTKQSLITPENNISIRLEAGQSILERKYQLRAHYVFNGVTGFVESEVNCSDLEKLNSVQPARIKLSKLQDFLPLSFHRSCVSA